MKTLRKILEGGYRIVRAELITQLHEQGHSLTGALEASITAKTKGEEIEASAFSYLHKLNEGVRPDDIKVNSQTLAEMTRYVQLRMGYQGGKAAQVAYLILQKQRLEGMPTSGSYAYSRTGERLRSLDNSFENTAPVLNDYMLAGVDEYIGFNDQNEDI